MGIIQLNRPAQLNALNDPFMDELGNALLAMDADENVGCIVLTGGSKVFAAGADITAIRAKSFVDVSRENFITRNWETILRIRKPVVAAVAGCALGGGCGLAMMCDMVIAAQNAKFGRPEIKLGIVPAAGAPNDFPVPYRRPRRWT